MIKSRFRSILALGLTALALTGCSSINKPTTWTEEQIDDLPIIVSVPTTDHEMHYYLQRPMWDLDNDGKIDIVYNFDRVICVAEGYQQRAKKQGLKLDNDTVVMTPEMRDDLTQIADAQKRFAKSYLEVQDLLKK